MIFGLFKTMYFFILHFEVRNLGSKLPFSMVIGPRTIQVASSAIAAEEKKLSNKTKVTAKTLTELTNFLSEFIIEISPLIELKKGNIL